MKHSLTILFILICAGSVPAQIIDYEIDESFNSLNYFSKGNISEIVELSNADLIISGSFFPGPNAASGWSILSNQGNVLLSSSLDFGPFQVQKFGDYYLTAGPALILRNSNATNAPDFKFEFQKSAYSGFISNDANCFHILNDSVALIGGIFFTDSMDISANSLRQLCMIDSSGAPIPDFPMVKCEPFDARIYSVDTLTNGELILAGSFNEVNGHPASKIAKLNSDFTVDTEFGSIFTLEGGAQVLGIDQQDRIWLFLAGSTLSSAPEDPLHFVRLLPSGELDNSFFSPTFTSYFDEFNPYEVGPSDLLFEEDGSVILVGNFIEVNGNDHKRIVQINEDGTVVSGAFEGLGADEAVWEDWEPSLGPIAGTWITEILRVEENKILLGGQFSSFGGEPYNCLVRLQPSGFVGTNDKEGRGKISVFPNPANKNIRLSLPNLETAVLSLDFYDLSGRLIYELVSPRKEELIDVSVLNEGMYLLRARTEKGIMTQKVVIER